MLSFPTGQLGSLSGLPGGAPPPLAADFQALLMVQMTSWRFVPCMFLTTADFKGLKILSSTCFILGRRVPGLSYFVLVRPRPVPLA